jgi:uncharacterized membrane protein
MSNDAIKRLARTINQNDPNFWCLVAVFAFVAGVIVFLVIRGNAPA